MSQQQFYETVQREQEWEHDMKLKTFADNIKEELSQSDEQYCYYCLTPKGTKWHCCHENQLECNHKFGTLFLDDFLDETNKHEDFQRELRP